MTDFLLAIDQGTTSTRAIVFAPDLTVKAVAQKEFPQHYPASGWVEHDPEDLWSTTLETCRAAIAKAGASARTIAGIGITNQRETTIVWDRKSGKAIHNAIVWQDRRTADLCGRLRDEGHEDFMSRTTGLLLDPYFSGTKLAWILEHVEGARDKAKAGELLFGTVDSFLLWRLTGGKVHATDATNASRTMLFDIHAGWSDSLCALFDIPQAMLPEVKDCSTRFGMTDRAIFGGEIPILGIAGDQHAASVGQACFQPGMMKSTYGTGCFALLNTGSRAVRSRARLLTTIAYQLKGARTYALEGSIFIAGAAVQWLRDGLGLIKSSSEAGPLAMTSDPASEIVLVPAFVGLGAPYWDAECRGAIFGLTRATSPADFARAALESVCFQTRDLLEAMRQDWQKAGKTVLRVDGGMVASDYTMQALADILASPVDRPKVLETTAVGAAYLAGLEAGVCPSPAEFARGWALDRRFEPAMDGATRDAKYARWREAVARTLSRPRPAG